LDPKGASGARRHIKEVIDPTSSLSLLPPPGAAEQPLQMSLQEELPAEEHPAARNNLSNESLEMPPLPTMDSDDGDHY